MQRTEKAVTFFFRHNLFKWNDIFFSTKAEIKHLFQIVSKLEGHKKPDRNSVLCELTADS